MSRTLLAIGEWQGCGTLIAVAIANGWSVLHTPLFVDIAAALQHREVDLILLSDCAANPGWERAARSIWVARRDTPIIALGSDCGLDWLVSLLPGSPRAANRCAADLLWV